MADVEGSNADAPLSETKDEAASRPLSSAIGDSAVVGPTGKIELLLKPTGDAPIMKKKKWNVETSKTLGWVQQFILRYLKMEGQPLFLYVSQTFAPAMDTHLGELYKCYGSGSRLVLHYCQSPAWG